ncbi:MAG: leucine-rich repeat domain-containing protein [Clostridia bacterium]|nr:leucine-rich repeat domain-containing protein [Clostridia bacterium]
MKKGWILLGLLIPLLLWSGCAEERGGAEEETSHVIHTLSEWSETLAPTCLEAGIEVRHCSGCARVETRAIAAKGHSFGEWIVTMAANCTDAGSETRSCSVCNELENRTVSAVGHSFSEWEITRAPTCEESGREAQVCSVCFAKVEKNVEPAGHAWESEWTLTRAPACESVGEKTLYCKKCSKTQTREIKPTGHSFSVIETKKPSLSEDGYEIKSCAACKKEQKECLFATGSLGIDFLLSEDGTCSVVGVGTFSGNELILPSYHNGYRVISIGPHAFSGCSTLLTLTLPDTVETIGSNAFEDCISLVSVRLGFSLREIQSSAFLSCSALSEVSHGENVTTVGKYAFWGCTALERITLGKRLVSVEELAFFSCDKLKFLFYGGEQKDWLTVSIGTDNKALIQAPRYYYSEKETAAIGKYWHYVDGVATKW